MQARQAAGERMTLARTCLIDVCYTVNNERCDTKGSARIVSHATASSSIISQREVFFVLIGMHI